jgi:[acyl-carrier-protein] S-malonyltransferase
MRPAADRFAQDVASVSIQAPRIPVLHNVDVASHQSPEAIRDALVRQLYNPVRWVETVRAMHARGVTTVLEMGPGKVLAGLSKRIDKSMAASPVQNPGDLEQALTACQGTGNGRPQGE